MASAIVPGMAGLAAAAARGNGASAVAARLGDVRPRARARLLGGIALLAAAYYGSAKLGYALDFSGPVAAAVWLPVGVGVAFLSVAGLAYWPGALAGDLLANDYTVLPLAGAFGQTVGNLAEVVLSAWLVRRLLRAGSPFDRTSGVARLLLALAAGPVLSAVVGPLSLALSDGITTESLPSVMRTWSFGDFCGVLVVVPLVLAWRRLPQHLNVPEGAALLAALGVVSAVAANHGESLTYLVFPLLWWTAVRFGVRGGTIAVLMTVATTIVTTTRVEGPFVSIALTHSVLSTQAFIVVAAASTLLFAAVMAERRSLVDRLGISQARASSAAETERRRIERDIHDGAQQRLLALAARLRLAAGAPTSDAMLAAERELQLAIDDLRELSHGTHPAVLTQLGLAGAVHTLAERSTVPVTLLELPPYRVDAAAEAAAYFVLTEAVANVHKHAHATAVVVSVGYRLPWLRLSVSDNGRGGADEDAGSGLAGLRARIEELDGELVVRSSSHGTHVSATIPAFRA
jgi:signal transduction histidine kinase